jgi:hypothetical protein
MLGNASNNQLVNKISRFISPSLYMASALHPSNSSQNRQGQLTSSTSHLSAVVISMLAIVPEVRGLNPAEAMDF